MEENQDLIEQLNRSGRKLSKSHRRIAQFITAHYDKAVFMTAAALGESVNVSESTVVRFAVALGYEGYPELQHALQELVRHRLTAVQRFEMTGDIREGEVLSTVLKADMLNIRHSLETLDNKNFSTVVDKLFNAQTIYVLGLRSAAPLAEFFGYYLQFIFDNVRVVAMESADVFQSISRVKEKDVLVGISFPRYSTRTLEAMHFAKESGAQVIGLTDGPMSPLHREADVCLSAQTDISSFVDSLVAPLSVINALLMALAMKKRSELSSYFEKLEEIWKSHRVYISNQEEK